MDLEKAKKEFIKYTSNYDINESHIAGKIGHSIRVMEISIKIAKSLNLKDEQIELSGLIGLLHDIARFEQWKRFETFKDGLSIDHGNLGVEILKENNFIRNFIEETRFDEIIFTSIKNHNKFKIEEGLDDENLLFCKIIRDADKIDIMYQGAEFFWSEKDEIEKTNNSMVSEKVYNEFMNKELVNHNSLKTEADEMLCFIGFIFDLYFEYSFTVLQKEDYINKILNKCDFKEKDKFANVRKVANEYIKNKG